MTTSVAEDTYVPPAQHQQETTAYHLVVGCIRFVDRYDVILDMRWLNCTVVECELVDLYLMKVQRFYPAWVYDAEPHGLFICCADAPEHNSAVLQEHYNPRALLSVRGRSSERLNRPTAGEAWSKTGMMGLRV